MASRNFYTRNGHHFAHMIPALPVMVALVAAFTVSILTSCGSAPVKPAVELGVIDYPSNQVIENMTNGASFRKIDAIPKATASNVTRAVVSTGNRVPLSSYDKAICLRPDWWDVEVNYIHSLERYISSHCGPGQ